MFFYNVLSGKTEKFKPTKGKLVRFYTCGPTVYDYAHVGNLRTFIFEDLLRRSLRHEGYKVFQVMNLTDVDDKIIKRAKAEGKTIKSIGSKYTSSFFADIKKLNIEKAEVYPKATAHIKEMLSLIAVLVKKKFAYKGKDNSIYFDISKFKNYGKLSRLSKRQIKVGATVLADEYNKVEAQDFVLWKAKKEGEPSWPSKFGAGRPGWHIECSAMSMKYLGFSFDIHTGAVDLIFPHHENEIAQSEAATGKKFSLVWLEGEHILINGEKMSKSLKNFFTLRDLEAKNLDPLSFRYLVLGTHYRKKLNFSWKSLASAENALNNLRVEVREIKARKDTAKTDDKKLVSNYKNRFNLALGDDLNVPKALGILWEVVKDKKISNDGKLGLIYDFDGVFGLSLKSLRGNKSVVPPHVRKLVVARERLRTNKQFIQADALRKEIEKLGYKVEDKASGPLITPINNA